MAEHRRLRRYVKLIDQRRACLADSFSAEEPNVPSQAIAKIAVNLDMTDVERRAYAAALQTVKTIKRGSALVEEGESTDKCAVLLDGFAARQKQLSEGRTQITSFVVPGDMCDLHSLLLKPLDHTITAISNCRVAYMRHTDVWHLIANHPRLGRAFWRETLIDGAIMQEWVANVGARNAYTRLAHLLSEFYVRLNAVNLVENSKFALPLSQDTLASATGLSTVHVNRTMQRLKREGIVAMRVHAVTVRDRGKLFRAGDFDQSYLYSRALAA
jgi:CRP-like cAMP-binding protein